MKTAMLFILISAGILTAQVAPKSLMPFARDQLTYHWPTNTPVKLYQRVESPAPLAAKTGDLPPFPTAALSEDTDTDTVAFTWDVVLYTTNGTTVTTNGTPQGFIIFCDSPTGKVQVASTDLIEVAVPALPGVYYVMATNKFGLSALSKPLVYPKPVTNILTFGSDAPEWPVMKWTNKPTAAAQQFYRVLYELFPSGTNKARVVFSSDANAPLTTNNWQAFTPWPPITTVRRNIKLYWNKETQ